MTSLSTRIERDAMGDIAVATAALWGAQTQRSLEYFRISNERMPISVVLALVRIKRAGALVNQTLGLLDTTTAQAIVRAADEVLNGQHHEHFPLSVWQTGSGTQSNMNVNEVLANRASELLGGERGTKRRVHPNDDVNLGQSSNDAFPSAIHIALAQNVHAHLLPALGRLEVAMRERAQAFDDIVKIGRTHLQDAVPMRLGQEFSGYAAQLARARIAIENSLVSLYELALGGTAVGTGLNTHPEFGERIAEQLARDTGLPLRSAPNKFEALASHGPIVIFHGACKALATSLHKIANDIRWLASGPRSGLAEIRLPENEPGSSIMPGKVNPTQAEALTMVCARVLGNDTTISFCDANGAFELNVYKPVIADAALQSVRLLSDAMNSFCVHCVQGIEANRERMDELLQRSLMLVTALVPHIGYDKAARIAKAAHARGLSLKESAIESGELTAEQFDAWVRADEMTGA
ncbi:MAG TPA: class II fumarate hydratase [Burkholderiaceae bacterium]|nr:class II fumarate hydratase [Burkholderiaceae bacterium]